MFPVSPEFPPFSDDTSVRKRQAHIQGILHGCDHTISHGLCQFFEVLLLALETIDRHVPRKPRRLHFALLNIW
jgi:hypothetical protein